MRGRSEVDFFFGVQLKLKVCLIYSFMRNCVVTYIFLTKEYVFGLVQAYIYRTKTLHQIVRRRVKYQSVGRLFAPRLCCR